MNKTFEAHSLLITLCTGLAAAFAFFSAPLFAFVDPNMLQIAGLAMTMGAGIAIGSFVFDKNDRFTRLAGIGMVGLGWALLTINTIATADTVRANSARCFNIQREMLLPRPRRTDLTDLFTALKCQPQGRDDIQFPKSHVDIPIRKTKPIQNSPVSKRSANPMSSDSADRMAGGIRR